MELSKKISWSWLIIGICFIFTLFPLLTLGQTETPPETTAIINTEEIPEIESEEQIPSDLVLLAQDLNCSTKTECSEKFEEDLEEGIALAEKHKIYNAEEQKLATVFQREVLAKLSAVSQEDFEEQVVALAREILNKKPSLAKQIGFTKQEVEATETIVQTMKDAGVNLQICRQSPETLSREQLISCVKAGNDLASKEKNVEQYISKEQMARSGEMQQMFALDQALANGEYPELGNITIEKAGQICLRPESKSITDCDKIAERFFGAEGINELQRSRERTSQVKDYYLNEIEKIELVTPEGKKIIGKGAIKNACDMAFEQKNLGLAKACGNFAVKNGFASEEDVQEGLSVLESFAQKSKSVNFDKCRFDPESCRDFMPNDSRSKFDLEFKIFKIMSESIGFDPSRCENSFDQNIGQRCLDGAKNALPQIKKLAENSPEMQKLVAEIESHISQGERMSQKVKEFDQSSSKMSGPGGCANPEACYSYCSQPENSAECISFGSKHQIFDQQTVVEKFNKVNNQLNNNFRSNFNFQPYQPFQRNFEQPYNYNHGDQQSFGQSYPYQNQYSYPQSKMMGPSPECMGAISNGDFAKAKTICLSSTQNYPKPIAEPYPICPAFMPSPCPTGQMRQQDFDSRGCPTYGACVAISNEEIEITKTPICPSMPTVSSCENGQEKYVVFSSKECGIYYGCKTKIETKQCATGQYWDGQVCIASNTATYNNQCDMTTEYWKMSNNTCVPRSNCYNTGSSDYNSMECQGVRGSMNNWESASGCGSYTTQSSCVAVSGCGWANGACGGNATGDNYNTTAGACPSGQYWYYPSGSTGGSGYCASTTNNYSSDPASGCQQAGGTWNSSTNYCQMPTNNTSCGMGTYWNGSYCQSNTDTNNYNSTSNYNNTDTYNTMSPSAACAEAGGSWNSSNSYCQMPESNTNYSGSTGSYDSSGTTDYNYSGSGSGGSGTTESPPPTSSMILCSEDGGIWTGGACNLAQNEKQREAYYSYFLGQNNNMLGQAIKAFSNLFK